MQIIENWTCVTGVVLAVSQPVADVRAKIDMQITRASEVKGFRSLLPNKTGDKITLSMPEDFAPKAETLRGKTITLPVRMARAGKYFAHADWTLHQGSPLCGPNPPGGEAG